jgi:hypothetical protein
MRRLADVAVAWGVLAVAATPSPAKLVDAVLAVVEARTVAASDVALARALGVLGFQPSTSPIDRADLERFIDVLLILDEATRVGVAADPAQIDGAWTAAVAGWGDETTFQRWLDANTLQRSRARRLVEDDVVRARFIETRFTELTAGESAEQAQREWLEAARRRASIRVLLPAETSMELPFPPR